MTKEFRSFRPENFSPEVFMHPPTEIVSDELMYLNRKLEQTIKGHSPKRKMMIGSEFEILFFNPNQHPFKTLEEFGCNPTKNRNYSAQHRNKIKEMSNIGESLMKKYPEKFIRHSWESNLMLEYRTAPQDVEGYYESVQILADTVRKHTAHLDILPVVYSQHIHITLKDSIFSRMTGINKIDKIDYHRTAQRLTSSFNRIYPLVLLPEEYPKMAMSYPAQIKTSPFRHPEFRMLSSEWANDPVLNLNLSLRALYAAFIDPKSVSRTSYFAGTYKQAVDFLSVDQELARFFGHSTLDTLCQIVSNYPAVEANEIEPRQIQIKKGN